MDVNPVLADLAQQYERSCFLLSQIEDSLKDRVGTPGSAVEGAAEMAHRVPAHTADEAFYEESAEKSGNVSTAGNQPMDDVPTVRRRRRKFDKTESTSDTDDLVQSTRLFTVIDLSTAVLPCRNLPRRAASVYFSSSGPLHPTTALNRRPAVEKGRPKLTQPPSQEQQQQQQARIASGAATRRAESGSGLGPATAVVYRLSNEHVARARQVAPDAPRSPLQASLPDIHVQPLHSFHSQPLQLLQPQQLSGPSRPEHDRFTVDDLLTCPMDTFKQQQQREEQQQQKQQVSEEVLMRRRSVARRGSDYVFSPLGGTSCNTGIQQQQLQQQLRQLGSQARPTAVSGCSSPVSLATSAGGFSGAFPPVPSGADGLPSVRQSISNNLLGLRSPRTQPLPPWATDEMELWPSGSGSGPSSAANSPVPVDSRAYSEQGKGMETALFTPRAACGGGLPQVKTRTPPARARSFSNPSASAFGLGSPLKSASPSQRRLGLYMAGCIKEVD